MARMIPPTPAAGTQSDQERVVFAELERQLGPDYVVLHSVTWLARNGRRARDGEADFIIAHPKLGVLVIEVKGGGIGRDGSVDRWWSIDRHGDRHQIRSPFDQARSTMYALRDKVRDAPTTRPFTYPIARAVALPDILLDRTDLGPDIDRAMVIDSHDLSDLGRAIARAWTISDGPRPGKAGIDALVELLRPSYELRRSGLFGEIARERQEFIQLTEQQKQVLSAIGGFRRAAIEGTAGSGKTMLAIEKARRLAAEGFRVLFTCYNKALADWVSDVLTHDLGLATFRERLVVDNYHIVRPILAAALESPFPPRKRSPRGATPQRTTRSSCRSICSMRWRPSTTASTRSSSTKGRISPIFGG